MAEKNPMKCPEGLVKPLDRVQRRMPMSYWTDRGNAPPDSYWEQYQAYLRRNPHHELNHPEHYLNRKGTRFYDRSGR